MNGSTEARNERVKNNAERNPCLICGPRRGCNQFTHRYPRHGTKKGKGSK